MEWFKLNSGGNAYNPSSYTLDPNPSCIGNDTLCAILAEPDVNNKPVITGSLQTAIANALNGVKTQGVTILKSE